MVYKILKGQPSRNHAKNAGVAENNIQHQPRLVQSYSVQGMRNLRKGSALGAIDLTSSNVAISKSSYWKPGAQVQPTSE